MLREDWCCSYQDEGNPEDQMNLGISETVFTGGNSS